MATYNLRRFARPDTLKAITPENLVALFRPYSDFLEGRGVTLPSNGDGDLEYEHLAEVLITPDIDTPADLERAEALLAGRIKIAGEETDT